MKEQIEPHRKSIRLKDYDYSQPGAYFITICTQNNECILGKIIGGSVELSPIGAITSQYWDGIPNHFENVELDEYVVMPNHIHGIIVVHPIGASQNNVGVQNFEPLHFEPLHFEPLHFEPLHFEPLLEPRQNKFQHIIPKSIGSIIRSYKSAVTHWCKQKGYEYFQWQRNYYEHLIRNEDELNKIRDYIINNPLKWESDFDNPQITKEYNKFIDYLKVQLK